MTRVVKLAKGTASWGRASGPGLWGRECIAPSRAPPSNRAAQPQTRWRGRHHLAAWSTPKNSQFRATANWSHLMLGFLGHRGFFVAAKGGKKVVRVQPLVHLMLGFCQLFQPCPPLLQPSSPFCPGTRKSFGRFAPVAIMSCAFLHVLSRVLAAGEDSLTLLLPNPIRSSPVSSSPPPFVNAKLTCFASRSSRSVKVTKPFRFQ